MDDLDIVYEISSIGDENWYLTKESYEQLIRDLQEGLDMLCFVSYWGSTVYIPLRAISSIRKSTKEQRQKMLDRFKQVHEEHKAQDKEPWE